MDRRALVLFLGLSIAGTSFAGEFRMLDDGTGTKQVAHDGQSVYALKENGNIWQFAGGRWQMIDDGSGTKQIAADAGRVYALKNNGKLFRRTFGAWSAIGLKGSRAIAVGGKDVYTLEDNDDVWMFSSATGQWSRIDNGTHTRMICADAQKGLYVLKESGNIFHHVGGTQFELADDGTGTAQIASSGGILYALKNNGNIYRLFGQWSMIDNGTGTKQMVADDQSLYCLKNNGNVWMFASENWAQVDNGSGTRQIEAKNGELVILKENGNIFAGSAARGSDIRTANFERLYGQ